jgi:pimeloyl-ACP methyl ester carboxylesterase
VLLLHGFPDSAHSWDRTITALAGAGFRAVAPFMRGYAPSGVAPDGRYDSQTLGRDVLALIEALGETSAIVVGHDWGAGAAYAAATHAPERIRKLVTLAIPHPRSIKPSLGMLWKARHFFALGTKGGPKRLRANEFAYVDALWQRWSPAWKQIPPGETAQVKRALTPAGAAEAACAYYAQFDRKTKVGNIKVPTVAFAGETDVIEPRAYERARRCFDAAYEVIIVPGGHFMHREHPDTFNAELVKALVETKR